MLASRYSDEVIPEYERLVPYIQGSCPRPIVTSRVEYGNFKQMGITTGAKIDPRLSYTKGTVPISRTYTVNSKEIKQCESDENYSKQEYDKTWGRYCKNGYMRGAALGNKFINSGTFPLLYSKCIAVKRDELGNVTHIETPAHIQWVIDHDHWNKEKKENEPTFEGSKIEEEELGNNKEYQLLKKEKNELILQLDYLNKKLKEVPRNTELRVIIWLTIGISGIIMSLSIAYMYKSPKKIFAICIVLFFVCLIYSILGYVYLFKYIEDRERNEWDYESKLAEKITKDNKLRELKLIIDNISKEALKKWEIFVKKPYDEFKYTDVLKPNGEQAYPEPPIFQPYSQTNI
jgi:hypothetical protein